jgi:radical SAM superfamily enzyme YgiQ (UPF0313 family)
MKVTLIRPNIGRLEHSLFVDEARMEPLSLGVIAALTPRDVDLVLHDDRIEDIPFDEPTDLVAITVETFTARRAYEIASEYRARGVPVITGGIHPTLVPQEAKEHCDSVYTGDAEPLWRKVLEDARRGKLAPFYHAPPTDPQPGLLTRRDLFSRDYLPLTLLQHGRGCRNACEYCAISAYFGASWRCRPPEETVADVISQQRRYVFFVDDNIAADHEAAKRLFKALIPLRIRWVSQASLDVLRDRELMDLMVRSGCLGNVMGFESITEESLRTMGKAPNLGSGRTLYREELAILRDYGLQTWAAFTLGYDHDTTDSIERTLEFAQASRFTFAAFNVLMPYPATPLYARLAADGRLLYDGRWWLHPEYRFNSAAFVPARMSAEELTQAGFRCRSVFNSPGSIFRRFFDVRTNLRSLERMAVYLLYNPLFRKETFKKHGMRLGTS